MGMPSLDLAEGGANAVPRDRLEVLHEAPPGPVDDRVEADGANAQVGEEGGAFRPRRCSSIETRTAPGRSRRALPALGIGGPRRRPGPGSLVRTDPDATRYIEVGVHRDAHAEAVASSARSRRRRGDPDARSDPARSRVALLLLVHPRQSDGRCHRLRTLRSSSARHSGRRTQSCEADRGRSMTQAGHRPWLSARRSCGQSGGRSGRVVRCRGFHGAALLVRRRDHCPHEQRSRSAGHRDPAPVSGPLETGPS